MQRWAQRAALVRAVGHPPWTQPRRGGRDVRENVLYLPSHLPDEVLFVLSTRPRDRADLRLQADSTQLPAHTAAGPEVRADISHAKCPPDTHHLHRSPSHIC